MCDFDGFLREKVGECGVGVFAVLVVLEGFQRWVLLFWVPCWEVVSVLQPGLVSVWLQRKVVSMPFLTFAPWKPFFPASASGSNLVGASSLYAPKEVFFSLSALIKGTVMVSTAEGAMLSENGAACFARRLQLKMLTIKNASKSFAVEDTGQGRGQ